MEPLGHRVEQPPMKRGGGARAPPIGLWSMQNRPFLVLLRPIFCEKIENSPPIGKQPPLKRLNFRIWPKNQSQFRWRPFFFGDHLILGGKNVWISDFGRKISPNFGEDLFFFFGDHLILGEKNFEFLSFPTNFASIFGQTVWNWFKNNENSSQGHLHFSHSFKTAPPLFQILATRLSAYV